MKKEETQNIYQTGRTTPPKSHQGVITFLIILVILLCGIISGLSMMNIRLFRMLEQLEATSDEPAVSFYRQEYSEAQGVVAPALGLTGQELTALYQDYYDLPQGLYISHITPGSPAEQADLRCGDIVQAVGDAPIVTEADFLQHIAALQDGQQISITVYRDNSTITVPLTVAVP